MIVQHQYLSEKETKINQFNIFPTTICDEVYACVQ